MNRLWSALCIYISPPVVFQIQLHNIVQLHFTFARSDMSDLMHVISADQTEQWEKKSASNY